ncbi:MAG: FAD-dependent oxidoreductase [Acidobacteriota bacterium]
MKADAIVIGAGIVGAACADALSREGLSVRVLESAFAGGGTTSRAMGHLVVMDDSEAQFTLTRRSREMWTDWAPELPASCEDQQGGTLWVAADDEELRAVAPKVEFYRARGVQAELLDARALAEAEPNLRPGLAGGMRVPEDRILYPPAAAKWLLERAGARGATLEERCEVTAVEPSRVQTRDGWTDTGFVIVAGGFTSARLLPGLRIEPRKGHLVISDRAPGFARHQLVELGYLTSAHGTHDGSALTRESVAFNLQPRATGQMLLGSSREFVDFDDSINSRLRDRMIRRALEYMPALAGLAAIRTWIGFRPCTPDNLPLIGAWGEAPGLFVATGHEGLGITTAPGTGELIADLVLGRRGALDPLPYAPHRAMDGHS